MEANRVERQLMEFRAAVEGRDVLVREAQALGVSKNRIHALTGISRTTIDRILAE